MRYIHHYLILLDNLKHFCVNKSRVITLGLSVFLFSPPVIPAGRHSQHLHSDCSPPAPQQEAAALARPEFRKPGLGLRDLSCFPSVSIDRATLFYVTLRGIWKEKSCQIMREIWQLLGSKCSLLTVLTHVLCALEQSCCFQWSHLYKQILFKVTRVCIPWFLFSFGPFV